MLSFCILHEQPESRIFIINFILNNIVSNTVEIDSGCLPDEPFSQLHLLSLVTDYSQS